MLLYAETIWLHENKSDAEKGISNKSNKFDTGEDGAMVGLQR